MLKQQFQENPNDLPGNTKAKWLDAVDALKEGNIKIMQELLNTQRIDINATAANLINIIQYKEIKSNKIMLMMNHH